MMFPADDAALYAQKTAAFFDCPALLAAIQETCERGASVGIRFRGGRGRTRRGFAEKRQARR